MKRYKIIFAIIIVVIASRLWLGIYVHDEFGENHLFIKHRPTWKWKFSSPIGMSDKQLVDLPVDKRNEQLMFNEFVKDQGLSR